jgi:UDP-N-acetyl-alpha-D-quinovosamine dehydrogenase
VGVCVVVSSRRVLITGCSGFIGRSLVEACLTKGWAVRGSIRGRRRQSPFPAGVETVDLGDIGPGTDWTQALQRVDAVVHLAARVHRDRKDADGPGAEAAYFHTNTAGTLRLARAAAEAGVKRLVFLSTLKVNGEGRASAYRESDSEVPCGAYALSKYEAENRLREISARTELQTVILRPPLVYGPGVKANFLRLVHMIARRVPLPFKGVDNRRSLIYIDNLVDAILAGLNHPRADGNTFLIADDEALSTPDLIRRTAEALGVKPRLFACPMPLLSIAARMTGRGEDLRRLSGSLWADTSKIRQDLDWRPKFSLWDGLEATVSWYRLTRMGSTA